MRFGMIALVLSLGGFGFAAEPMERAPIRLSPPSVRAELVEVVSGQLAAFRAEDWEKAYGYASRSFQSAWELPQFVTLISRSYVVVCQNTRAEFGLPRDNGHVAIVPVRVFKGKDSEAYQWLLVKEDGHWHVTGVVPQRIDGGA